ncbi:hypothetical protein ZWY2020_059322, partial [Hordeum vulgare]
MASLSVPPVLTPPREDAVALHKAFQGLGCDSTTVTNILAHRDTAQRVFIQQEYKAIYHEDLYHRLATELSGNHKNAMLLWVLDPVGRDATILNQALNGNITDLRATTEVICSRTPSQLQIMKQTYRARFVCYLEHDITERTCVGLGMPKELPTMPDPSNVGFNVQRLPEDQVGAAKGAMVQADLVAGEAKKAYDSIASFLELRDDIR